VTALVQGFGHSLGHRQLAGPVFIIRMVSRNQTIAPKNFFHDRSAFVVRPVAPARRRANLDRRLK
jgi:hypothetical protein